MSFNFGIVIEQNKDYNSFKSRFESLYLQKINHLVTFLCKKNMNRFAGIAATFLIEPQNALYSGFLMHKGIDTKKVVNLNLKSLSKEQMGIDPVLFIHGDSSSSSLFAPMIDQVIIDHPNKPIFTIDLKSSDGIVSEKKHLSEVIAKVSSIGSLYFPARKPKISFVGHSSGGDILGPLVKAIDSRDLKVDIGILFKIGSVFKKIEIGDFKDKNFIEIVGTKDVLEGSHSYLPQHLIVNSGHLGLLYNKVVKSFISKKILVFDRSASN